MKKLTELENTRKLTNLERGLLDLVLEILCKVKPKIGLPIIYKLAELLNKEIENEETKNN